MAAPDKTGFWNQAAGTKQFTHPLDHVRLTHLLPRDASILDFGCGQGRLSAELMELGFRRVVGVDSAPEMVRAAGKACPGFSFVVNDGGKLPFEPQSFDAILLFAVLTCIPDDAAQKILLVEFKRTMRPGGLLLISDRGFRDRGNCRAGRDDDEWQPGADRAAVVPQIRLKRKGSVR